MLFDKIENQSNCKQNSKLCENALRTISVYCLTPQRKKKRSNYIGLEDKKVLFNNHYKVAKNNFVEELIRFPWQGDQSF